MKNITPITILLLTALKTMGRATANIATAYAKSAGQDVVNKQRWCNLKSGK